jgi:hypothetical protein
VRRHDFAAQAWLLMQLSDIVVGTSTAELVDLRRKLEALLGEEAGSAEYMRQTRRYFASRRVDDNENINGHSVEQMEDHLAQAEAVYGQYSAAPAGMTQIDTYFVAQGNDSARATLIPVIGQQRAILARVRQGVHTYLTTTEAELEAGKTESGFFDHVQSHINALLAKYAPEAAQNFVGAQERIVGGGSEDISHALTSCRRMIKSLADSLYPATNESVVGLDGVARQMSDEAYKNRLSQYVRDKVGKHKNGPALQAVISQLASRLNSLDGLASKGVHADPSIDEARTCVAQTYFLAGDLLSIAEGTSYLLQEEGEGADD